MKKRKRILPALLAFLLLLTTAALPVYADTGDTTTNDWQFKAFGSGVSATKNPSPEIAEDGSVTLRAVNGGGKIAGSDMGVSLFYKEMGASSNFALQAKAKVLSFKNSTPAVTNPGQISFGLMISDKVELEKDNKTNYVAVGTADLKMKPLYFKNSLTKSDFKTPLDATANATYDLSIQKSGNAYKLTLNDQSTTLYLDGVFTDTLFAGLYVARDAEVTFSDISLQVDQPAQGLQVSTTKTQYLLTQPLDLSTLTVTAQVYGTGEDKVLQPKEYLVTGYNPNQLGDQTVTISYKGAEAQFDVNVMKLDVVDMRIKYLPAKTVYYIGDTFDSAGMEVTGDYNNHTTAEITKDKYTLSITGTTATTGATVTDTVYTFQTPGTQTVTVRSLETPSKTAAFDVLVKSDVLTGLEIAKQPAKTSYFLNEILSLDGMILYANYNDGSKVRLLDGEYHVSGPDMTTAGTFSVVLSFREMETSFPITVKAKSVTGLEVQSYPKTTYLVGESFDTLGLKVVKVYDNGDRDALIFGHDYTLDTSAFDSSKPGIYELPITPVVEGPAPTVLKVEVRQQQEVVWNSIVFGQSTSSSKNTVTVGSDGKVELVALEGAGKVTGDHDGISYYYTELDAEKDNFELSATINVKAFAKTPYDGQESFGIMARDAIGTAKDSSVFASNIAAIGGFSGGTGNPIGTQLFVRTGVTTPDGAGSKGIQKIMLNSARPGPDNTPYVLTLGKNNSGFYGKIDNGSSKMYFVPDILKVQDSKMYVGFYAARLATIEVSNIKLQVTSAAADAPKVEPPLEPIQPSFDILSLNKVSSTDYSFRALANVNGTLTLRKGQDVVRLDEPVQAGVQTVIPAALVQGDNTFSATFLPDNTQFLTSENPIVKNFTVTMKSFGGSDLIVSPQGTAQGAGTVENPLDLNTAIDFVQPGQRIVLQEGVYKRSAPLMINKYNDGTDKAKKYLVAAPGTRPVIDFDKKSEGVILGGSYWHVKGIDFTRSADNLKGFTVGGSYNTVEDSRFYENGDTGLQISRTDGSDNRADWPSHNLILNSTSFDNRDPSENNADGFAAKLTVGEGNIFRGCISHNNIDDGWDLYTKAGTGAIGAVIIEDSIAYNNGTLTNGEVGSGDKNGFKLGGEGIHVPHIIRNSYAFGNGAYGFTSNSNPGIIVEDNIAFDNARGNLNLSTYTGITPDFQLKGFISYQKSYTAADTYPSSLASDSNYLFKSGKSSNKSGVTLTDSNFISLTPVTPTRDAQGKIVLGDFLKFVTTTSDDDPTGPSNPVTPSPTPTPSVPGPTQPAETKPVLEGPNGLELTKESVAYLSGYEDGSVRPDNRITREEVLSLFYGLLVNSDKGQTTGSASFKDLSASNWSTPAIQYFLQKGLVNGYEDGTFRPAAAMTRAELVAILVQFLPKTSGQAATSFSDSGSHWAKSAIEQAAAAGWVNGYEDGSFRPDQSITRAETVVLLNRALGRTPNPEQLSGKKGFSDLDSGHWAYYHLLESSK